MISIYKIADFNIDFNERFTYSYKFLQDYLSDINVSDCNIEINRVDLEKEQDDSEFKFKKDYLEYIAPHRKLVEWLPLHNAFVLHSACFDVGGVGVAFAAHSGTDKS